jgi:sulfite reductase (ferredoxin)
MSEDDHTSHSDESADSPEGTKKPDLPSPGSDDDNTKKPDLPSGTTTPDLPSPGDDDDSDPKTPAAPAGGDGTSLPPGYSPTQDDEPDKSETEIHKEESEYLYSGIPEKLAEDTDHFLEEQKEVLKHCGIYQQDDRDLRKELDDKHYYFFVRSSLPGGKLTADQYLVHDRLADAYGIGTIRITTRQGIQLHGVVKDDLKQSLRELNEAMVTTLGACGDVVRNTMCCPAPIDEPLRDEIQEYAEEIAEITTPDTPAYHDVWLKEYDDEEKSVETIQKIYDGRKERGEDLEPLYGKAYLPRKFKIGFAAPGDNCVDVFTHDVGLIAVADGDELQGFNVLVGGGLGNTHNKPKTFPRLADRLGYVPKEDVLDLITSIIKIQRDNGDRKDRMQARMKYLIDDWGLETFHDKVEERFGRRLDDWRDVPDPELDLHEGWNEQGDGHYFYGISVENGRIKDEKGFELKTALRKIVEQLEPGVHLTPNHDLLLTDLHEEDKETVETILHEHGVALPDELTNTQKYSMACPALPSCGLALTESERVFPQIIDEIEAEMSALGLDDVKPSIRMTGCPNGCSRPYVADIGIVGESLHKYKIYLGGRLDGSRLNEPFQGLVDIDEVVPTVRSLLRVYADKREGKEPVGDFFDRIGFDKLESLTQNGYAVNGLHE